MGKTKKQTSISAKTGYTTLTAHFDWQDDRFVHRITIEQGEKSTTLLESIEGDADSLWPASPPLQELHIESREEEEVCLLVGQAGKSHWSMAVSPIAGRAALLFDVACRLRQPPKHLGSTYRGCVAAVASGRHTAKLTAGEKTIKIRPAIHCGEGATDIDVSDDRLIIVPTSPGTISTTAVWSYEIAVELS